MIQSSIALGCLPDQIGGISWITPEAVSGAILDVALGPEQFELALNVAHPRPITWTMMVETAANELFRLGITRERLPLVKMDDWYAKIAGAAIGADDACLKQIVSLLFRRSESCLIKSSACDQGSPILPSPGHVRRSRSWLQHIPR
jgi:hypothetical protein